MSDTKAVKVRPQAEAQAEFDQLARDVGELQFLLKVNESRVQQINQRMLEVSQELEKFKVPAAPAKAVQVAAPVSPTFIQGTLGDGQVQDPVLSAIKANESRA